MIAADEVFTSLFTYDALDRQTASTEPNGQTTTYKYDSRNNRIKTIDPLGNETEMVYDRLNRLVETRTDLSANGLNASAANKDSSQSGDGIVTLKREWDDLSRLTAQIDDQGNRTEYAYDDLNRKVRTTYQDGTFETWEYNDDSDVIKHTNQNGSIETSTYDAKSRRTELVVSHPVGLEVGGTTRKTWGYDGLDRVMLTTDNNGPGADDDVTYTYVFDSLSRQIRETQKIGALPALSVDAEWQGASRKVAGIYPSGRKVLRSYDALDRLFEIKEAADNSLVSRFEYVGPGRDIRTTYGNGSILDKRNSAGSQTISGTNPGFDGNRRSLRHEWKSGAGQQITAYVTTWNGPAGVGTNRRASEQREHLSNHTDTYGFDSKYRMTGFRRDGSGIGSGGALSTRTLNGADKTVALNDGGSAVAIDLGTNDEYARMNQYKTFGGQPRTYDHNASLDSDGTFKYIQDFNNRIGEIRRASDNATVAKYVYDVNNRRVLRDVGGTKTRYLYEGWQVVEERDGNNVVLRQYVDGREIDEHIQLKDGVSGSVFYYHSNSQGIVGAMTGTTGGSVEFYEYDWYGKPTILASDRTTQLTTSSVGNSYLFQGRSLDSETATASSPGLYYFRNRYYSPGTGEFLTIDPLGCWNHGQGNGFSAFGEDGWNEADPMGLGLLNVPTVNTAASQVPRPSSAEELVNASSSLPGCSSQTARYLSPGSGLVAPKYNSQVEFRKHEWRIYSITTTLNDRRYPHIHGSDIIHQQSKRAQADPSELTKIVLDDVVEPRWRRVLQLIQGVRTQGVRKETLAYAFLMTPLGKLTLHLLKSLSAENCHINYVITDVEWDGRNLIIGVGTKWFRREGDYTQAKAKEFFKKNISTP